MKLSYAAADLRPRARRTVRAVEAVTGGRKIAQATRRFEATEPADADLASRDFYRRVADAFDLTVEPHVNSAGRVPATGPLLVVANHPFGVIDGLAIAALVERERHDLRIVIWNAIRIPDRLKRHYIPLDLDENNRDARRQNARARREMIDHLKCGGSLLLFPAGTAAYAERAFSEPLESSWTPMMARIARASNATVLPAFVGGQNSRVFHVTTKLSMLLRRALFIHETVRRMGGSVEPVFGEPVHWSSFAEAHGDDARATAKLRQRVLSLDPSYRRQCA